MMTTEIAELKLETSRVIDAAPEVLFDAWLDPQMLARFMRPGDNMSVPEARTDPRVGGRFHILMQAGGNELPHEGTYVTIDRPHRLEFTWESPASTLEGSTVTLEFKAVDGGTEVSLTHVRFPSEESRDNHEGGWTRILATLAETV